MAMAAADAVETRKNFRVQTHDAVEVLSANREFTRLIAVGNRMMKIYAIEESRFRFATDFRAQRTRKNLLDAPTHVDWSSLVDNLIATTFADGVVGLWNAEREIQQLAYQTHGYKATRVRFHRFDPNLLLSAAKNELLLYDTRVNEPVKRFYKDSTDAIHDIQFGVHDDQKNYFVTSDDGGMLSFFEIRGGERLVRNFLTHRGPAAVTFNPNYFDRNLVVTGGRDKTLRVWNWTNWSKGTQNDAIYSVDTYTPVGKVFWRPSYKFHIASYGAGDSHVYVWDVRRPFLPFAVFSDHDCPCVDMVWNPNIEDRFVSVGRDGVIVLHYVENSEHPMNYVSDMTVDTSPAMELVFAVSSQLRAKNEALDDIEKRQEGKPIARRRRNFDPFQSWTKSHLISCVPKGLNDEVSVEDLSYLAKGYKLAGADVKTLCDYNSRVAQSIGYFHLAQTWRTVAVLASLAPDFVDPSKVEDDSGLGPRFLSARYAGRKGFQRIDSVAIATLFAGQVASAGLTSSDFYFGDGEFNMQGLKAKCFDMTENGCFVGTFPPKAEAFKPRIAEDFINLEDSSVSSGYLTGTGRRRETADGITPIDELSVDVDRSSEVSWSPLPTIRKILDSYAELGDVQTCASVLLVLGESTVRHINAKVQILWFCDYLELLDRLELFVTSAEVIKRCWFPSISNLSLQSTFVRVACLECKTISLRTSPYCSKCEQKFNFICCVCNSPVRGVWGWCRECRHGGHPNHLEQWFASYYSCPTGCKCKCTMAKASS